MKPRRVPTSNFTFTLSGGNEDNDLWCEKTEIDGQPVTRSVWELTEHEKTAIAQGGTIELLVWGTGHPPVALDIGPSMEMRAQGDGIDEV